ncbi:MAG: PAS domain S-box protein [Bacteroidetes bacterium]|nr:PAS domain S-box protein [Bacteroidota bacterium]
MSIIKSDSEKFPGLLECTIERNKTELKQAEKALKDSETRYRRLFEAAQDGILILDADTGQITDINPYLQRMLGYARTEVLGKTLWGIGLFKDILANYENFLELQSKEYIRYEDLPLETKGGKRRQVEFVSNVYLVDGKKTIQCNIRDITERKQVEEDLNLFFNVALDMLCIADFRGNFVRLSPMWTKTLGWTDEELKAKPFVEFVHPDDRDATLKATFRLSEGIEVVGFDNRYQCKDGSYRMLSWNSFGVVNRGLIIAAARDITDRNRAEIHLQESEERYRRLVEFSPDAIMVHSYGKFVYVNPAAIKLLGANEASELLGKPVIDIVHPDYRKDVRFRIETGIIENKTLQLMEEKFLRLDGAIIDVGVASLPIEYNGIPSMHDVVRDITEQKKLQQELLQSQKIQSIGTLASGIAHDFNNILGIILGYASLIEKNKIDALRKSESIAAINQAVQRGAALVRQILTFARKTDISFEPLSLTDLIQELISMLNQTFPKIIKFKKIFQTDIPFILADRTQIHQVLLNLCVNARDAMPGGGSITIMAENKTGQQLKEQFSAAVQELYVCISVTDIGEGMNEATRQRIFDPFFTTKSKGKGTGLGLSVVYGVVQAHHGFINVESEVGHGTAFRLYFPVPDISERPIDFQKVEPYETGGTETILLVEDEELLIEMVRVLLESKGYKVFTAQDGVQAMEIYEKNRQEIAIVLTDMGLPLMTGNEEFNKLKEIDPNVSVIFASGFFEPDVKSELLKAGARGFLQKPYMPDEILRVIREALDGKRIV